MRKTSLNLVYELAKKDDRVLFIGSDLGPGVLDDFKKNIPDRFFMEGIAEQHIIGMSAGLALDGFIPYVNTIATFITRRCFEQIAIDLCLHDLPVRLIGNGGGLVYAPLGPTHQAIEDISIMRSLPNLKILNPCDNLSSRAAVKIAYKSKQPVYIKLDKGFFPDSYQNAKELHDGLHQFNDKNDKKENIDLSIFSTGSMIEQAKKIKKFLKKENINASLIDIFRIKPLNKKKIINILNKSKAAITIEEQHIDGGIGSQICEVIVDNGISIPLKRFGINDEYCKSFGDREWLRQYYKIDTNTIIKKTLVWIKSRYKNG